MKSESGGRLRKMAMGAAAGLALEAGTPNIAEAQDYGVEQAPNPDFNFAEYSDLTTDRDARELLAHLPDWGFKPGADLIGVKMGTEYASYVIKSNQELVDSQVPWAHDALVAALQTFGAENRYDAHYASYWLDKLDTSSPVVVQAIDDSMEQIYLVVLENDGFWEESSTPVERRLVADAIHVAAVNEPTFVLQYLSGAKLNAFIPDKKEQDRILAEATVSAIDSGDDEDLRVVARRADQPEEKKLISKVYGWDNFTEKCIAHIPGTVLDDTDYLGATFRSTMRSPEKRLELFQSAARRDPQSLIGEANAFEGTGGKWLVGHMPSAEEVLEFNKLVDSAYYSMATEHLGGDEYDEYFWRHNLTPEMLEKHPGLGRGLAASADRDPARLLEVLNSSPVEFDRYREKAAHAIIANHLWMRTTADYSSEYTYELFGGLPNYSELQEQWFRAAVTDIPGVTFDKLLQDNSGAEWMEPVFKHNLMLILDEDPAKVDWSLANEQMRSERLELLLTARAQDDFGKAVADVQTRLEKNPDDAYWLLWVLERAQPYEYAAWSQGDTTKNNLAPWRAAVTKSEWSGLLKHSKETASDTSYMEVAESTAVRGLRFNDDALLDVAGMNTQHRTTTHVEVNGAIYEGKNFITIPMIAFEEIVTSAPFGAYIDAHAKEKLSFVNLCSTAQVTFRRMRDLHLEPTPENIRVTLEELDEQWQQVKNTEIFGPNTDIIAIAHGESRFDNDKLIKQLLLAHGGSADQVIANAKGPTEKQSILDKIEEARHTPITIIFNGHGGKGNLYLDSDISISARELGDALIYSHNIAKTHLVLGSCFSYDFADQLLAYLRDKEVDTTGLIIVSDANKDSLAFGGAISSYMEKVSQQAKGKPLTLEAFRLAETFMWMDEDPSITSGLPASAGSMTGIEVVEADEPETE